MKDRSKTNLNRKFIQLGILSLAKNDSSYGKYSKGPKRQNSHDNVLRIYNYPYPMTTNVSQTFEVDGTKTIANNNNSVQRLNENETIISP
jgi:hypothetical protein